MTNQLAVNQRAANQWETDQKTVNAQSLNSIYFIGLSPQSALESPDVLIEAFSQRRAQLANQQQSADFIACYDSMRFRASLHSMAITMQCSANLSQMQKVIMDFWQNESLDNINLETVQRNLKLNKHIGAFTGSEIDKANNNGVTPLMAAARDGFTNIVKMLLEAGADFAQVDEFGRTADSVAEEKGFAETAAAVKEWAKTHPVKQ